MLKDTGNPHLTTNDHVNERNNEVNWNQILSADNKSTKTFGSLSLRPLYLERPFTDTIYAF